MFVLPLCSPIILNTVKPHPVALAALAAGAWAAAQIQQRATVPVRTLLDRKVSQSTKARGVTNDDRQTFTQPGISGKELLSSLHTQAVGRFGRSNLMGQKYEAGKSDTSFWLIASSQWSGEAWMSADHDSKSRPLYTCAARFENKF